MFIRLRLLPISLAEVIINYVWIKTDGIQLNGQFIWMTMRRTTIRSVCPSDGERERESETKYQTLIEQTMAEELKQRFP